MKFYSQSEATRLTGSEAHVLVESVRLPKRRRQRDVHH